MTASVATVVQKTICGATSIRRTGAAPSATPSSPMATSTSTTPLIATTIAPTASRNSTTSQRDADLALAWCSKKFMKRETRPVSPLRLLEAHLHHLLRFLVLQLQQLRRL